MYVKKTLNLLLQISNWNRNFYTYKTENRPTLEFHLDWLEFWTFFYCVKKRNPYVKIFKNIYFLPVKIKIHTWKNSKMCPWKIWTVREKLQKSVRESDFLYVKKLEKRTKNSFTHTFDFHVGKKNTGSDRQRKSSLSPTRR